MPKIQRPDRASAKVLVAFAAVYVIWGSTYLAIRFAVESMPPFLLAAARFAISGVVLYAWCWWRGVPAAKAAQWRSTAIIGTLLLLGGNGLVTWGEQWVPSGLAALLVATMPLWLALMSWGLEPASRPTPRKVIGLVLGFVGVALLVKPGGELASDPKLLIGALGILAAPMLWASGSLYSRRADVPSNAFLSTAMQMITGGVALAIVGTLSGEWGRLDVAAITLRSWLAFGYLIVFGSIVAFSAFVWLVQVSDPAKVATYAYVNPVVAVGLGWALAGEAVTGLTIVAAVVIVGAVAMITTVRSDPVAPRDHPSSGPASSTNALTRSHSR